MTALFENILTASFHGSIVILVVLLLRPLLRKAPRKFVCLLWLMVGLRLLVPLEISSPMSLQPDTVPDMPAAARRQEVPDFVPDWEPEPIFGEQTPVVRDPQQPAPSRETPQLSAETETPETQPVKETDWMQIFSWTWLGVMLIIGGYSLLSYLRLRVQIREAVRIREGIWECDRIETAFILGYVRPRIYLPMNLSRTNRRHILAHERTHLEKGDHWYKLIGFIALAVHWFNPLVWVAYILLCKDIEMACDERVVQFMELEERKSYSAALLACSAGKAHFAACPVAFGEVSVKERIHRVLRYRKPSFWISLIAVAALAFVGVCFLTSPKDSAQPQEPGVSETTAATEPGETDPVVTAPAEHDLTGLQEQSRERDYTDPNGNHLYMSGNTTGMGVYFNQDLSFDDTRAMGRTVSVTDEYWVEKLTGSSWEKLPTVAEPAWTGMEFSLEDGSWSTRTDVQTLYGPLYEGQYRIGKTVNVAGTEYTYYAEFTRYINDPARDPEAAAARERVNTAIEQMANRDVVHIVGYYDGNTYMGPGKEEWELITSGASYLSTSTTQEAGQDQSYTNQSACIDGTNYVGRDGQWYNCGTDVQFFSEGSGWDYSAKLDNVHVTVSESTDTKLSLVVDDERTRSFRDYYFDGQGNLTQIESASYYYASGKLCTEHQTLEFHATSRETLLSRLNEIEVNAGNHTYEEYEQLLREEDYNTDFMLGSGQFLWRFGGWAFYSGGENATATGMTVNHECMENATQGAIYTDGAYWLERMEKGSWNRVPMAAGGEVPSGEAKLIFDNTRSLMAPTKMNVDWSGAYGELAPGFYRLAQSYLLKGSDGSKTVKTCYAKFRVYDPEMFDNVELCRKGMADLLARDTFQVVAQENNLGTWDAAEDPNRMVTTIWKRGGDYMGRTDYLDKNASHSYMLLGGKGYAMDLDAQGEITDWATAGYMDVDNFQIWTFGLEWYDAQIISATRSGNDVFITEQTQWGDETIVYESVCTFDSEGRLISLRKIRNGQLDTQVDVYDISREELDEIFANRDVTKPVSFRYAEDEAMFPYFINRKTEGFVNTEPTTISNAQEAVERAKNDCTIPELDDANGIHEGAWNLTKACFDESAQMWKVEFTFSQGGVYQAVYMTADGITTCVVG